MIEYFWWGDAESDLSGDNCDEEGGNGRLRFSEEDGDVLSGAVDVMFNVMDQKTISERYKRG